METHNGIKAVSAKDRHVWRKWLEKNHATEKSVWLIIYRKESDTPSVYYNDAVEEALCFGWIDSKPNKRDGESYYLFFAQRKPTSKWSGLNRKRVEKLSAAGLIAPAGQKLIDLAKQNGNWDALDEPEQNVIPPDLQKLLNKNKTALKHFMAFPPSAKQGILQWILNAKQPATRQKRIEETVTLAAQNKRANQYVPKK
jgi:uncharacterized protein YdeI (YjbR/CyaY-like superfamily)